MHRYLQTLRFTVALSLLVLSMAVLSATSFQHASSTQASTLLAAHSAGHASSGVQFSNPVSSIGFPSGGSSSFNPFGDTSGGQQFRVPTGATGGAQYQQQGRSGTQGDGGGFIGIIGGDGADIGSPPGGTSGNIGGNVPLNSDEPATVNDDDAENDCVVEDKLERNCIPLIQPLGTRNRLPVLPGAGTFMDYFNDSASLLLTVAIGFCILWILIGSYFIMVSGSDGGKRSTGMSMITWAIIGLIIVNFAGFFLRTLNNIFFV